MRAPALGGVTLAGASFSLDDQPDVPTVLVFYRSAQCGLCRVQLNELQRHLVAYRHLGVEPVAVTLDAADESRPFLENSVFDFDIVSVDSTTFETWGAFDPETGLAMPLTYILDGDGVVRFQHLGRNASDRALDAELLTVLETLNLTR